MRDMPALLLKHAVPEGAPVFEIIEKNQLL